MLGSTLLACAVLAILGRQAIFGVRARLGDAAEITTRAERALAAGNPESALVIAERAGADQPRLLLVRGRALVAIGDTSGAAAELRRISLHPVATAADALAAARMLASWPGQANAAADAYVQAFASGIPRSVWPEVMEALRQAGRGGEANRVGEFLRAGPGT